MERPDRLRSPCSARSVWPRATLANHERGEDPPRRDGHAERRARARAELVGVRDPAPGRSARGGVGAQALSRSERHEPAAAWPGADRGGDGTAAAGETEAAGGATPDAEA